MVDGDAMRIGAPAAIMRRANTCASRLVASYAERGGSLAQWLSSRTTGPEGPSAAVELT